MISNWPSRLALPALVWAMEAAWVIPLVALALNGLAGEGALFTPGMALGVFALAGLGARLLAEASPAEHPARAITVMVAAVSSLLAIWAAFFPTEPLLDGGWIGALGQSAMRLFVDAPSIAGTLMACGFLWLRGLRLAAEPPGFDAVVGRFRIGLALLVVYHLAGLILGSVPAVGLVTANLIPNVTAFFFCGLLALGLSRAEEERAAAPGRGLRFNRQWGLVLVAALVAELLLVLLLAALLAPDTMAFITAPFAFVGGLVLQVLSWALIALAYVVDAILRGILWLLAQFGLAPQPFQLETATAPEFPEPEEDAEQQPAIPEFVLAAARGGLVAILIVLALLLLWRSLRGRSQRTVATGDETRESVWSWDAAKRELGEALQALLARLRRRGALAVAGLSGLTGGVLDGDDLTSVRGVYRALLRAAARAGVHRSPQQTAGEFSAALAARLPDGAAEAAAVTAAYERVRYGPDVGAGTDLPPVVAAWRRLRAAFTASERPAPGQ